MKPLSFSRKQPLQIQSNLTDKCQEFLEKIKYYTDDALKQQFEFSTELIAIALTQMESGKSPGLDMLTAEHLNYCHPVIFALLSNLFNIMLQNC